MNHAEQEQKLVKRKIIIFGTLIVILAGTLADRLIPHADKPKSQTVQLTSEETLIKSQFSAWDGSHRNLEKYILNLMNDPDSYKHIETRYLKKQGYILVSTSFRGKNAFGAIVKQKVTARVDLSGNILERM